MIKKIMELSWVEIEELNKDKSVLFLGLAPVEEHGRHLPVGVDVYETDYWMEQAILKLERDFEDFSFLCLPVMQTQNI